MMEQNQLKAKDVLSAISKAKQHRYILDSDIEARKKLQELEFQQAEAELILGEKSGITAMRKKWSDGILFVILAVVAFDFFLISAIGLGYMQFKDSFTIPVIITESLIKVIGLALIVVKFLFDSKSLMQKS